MPRTKLPPDPENMNGKRSKWAGAALQEFCRQTGCDEETSLGDILCDLMHWSDRNNFDFGCALFRAQGHYKAEIGFDVERRPWPRHEREGKTIKDELAEALELCVECLSEFSRLDDGTPSVSALYLARAALAKAGRA